MKSYLSIFLKGFQLSLLNQEKRYLKEQNKKHAKEKVQRMNDKSILFNFLKEMHSFLKNQQKAALKEIRISEANEELCN